LKGAIMRRLGFALVNHAHEVSESHPHYDMIYSSLGEGDFDPAPLVGNCRDDWREAECH
jgi:hypothetical protein